MELGMTIPLQKFIKASAPPHGIEDNALFCWEVHVVEALESQRLFIVNAQNRFTVVLGNMAPGEWQNLTAVAAAVIGNEKTVPTGAEPLVEQDTL